MPMVRWLEEARGKYRCQIPYEESSMDKNDFFIWKIPCKYVAIGRNFKKWEVAAWPCRKNGRATLGRGRYRIRKEEVEVT